jgi:16S rRNA (guanine527-N7)-methyltransferase
MDSVGALTALAGRYGVDAASEEARRLCCYQALLEKWNARINLTASTAWPALGLLFEEALWAARFYPRAGSFHLDIGSGAGFPAVPLRILRPDMRLVLVDSRAKRCAFLETVAAELQLEGTEIVCQRAEMYLRSQLDRSWDAVSWKGIKLSNEAVDLLLAGSRGGTRYWLFQGSELPFADPAHARGRLRVIRCENFPGRPGWHLSILEKQEDAGKCFT